MANGDDPLAKAAPPVPTPPKQPYASYYSPESKAARQEELVGLVRKRNDAEDRLHDVQQSQGAANARAAGYKRGGKIRSFCKGGKVISSKTY